MNDRREAATSRAQELCQKMFDGIKEIIDIMDESVQSEIFGRESRYGLTVFVKGKEIPVSVPDAWVREWVTFCDGDEAFVVGKIKELGRWSADNKSKRKFEKNIRAWLGTLIARDYSKRPTRKLDTNNALGGYEKRNND